MFSDDDILRRAYARLLALKENLPERPHVSADYVEEFHGALFDLECLDYDVVPFHVQPACVRQHEERLLAGVSLPTGKKYVERAMLLTKITAVLVYFELSAPSAIEEEEEEQKEPAKIGFYAASKNT